MYCKNCGRKLKDGLRFCDYCGASIRQSQPSNKNVLKDQTAARIRQRGQRAELEERMRERKRRRRRKRSPLFIIIAASLCAAVVCGIAAYFYMLYTSDNSWQNSDGSVQLNSSPSPQPTPTAVPSSSQSPLPQELTLFTDSEYNAQYVYPASFVTDTFQTSVKFAAADSSGDGRISVTVENTSSTAVDLLKEYVASAGGELIFNRADNESYSVYSKSGETYRFRKGLVRNGTLLIYDFEFSQNSPTYQTYSGYVEYMDEYIDWL